MSDVALAPSKTSRAPDVGRYAVAALAGDFSGRVGHLVAGYAIGIALAGAVYLVLRTVDERQRSLV